MKVLPRVQASWIAFSVCLTFVLLAFSGCSGTGTAPADAALGSASGDGDVVDGAAADGSDDPVNATVENETRTVRDLIWTLEVSNSSWQGLVADISFAGQCNLFLWVYGTAETYGAAEVYNEEGHAGYIRSLPHEAVRVQGQTAYIWGPPDDDGVEWWYMGLGYRPTAGSSWTIFAGFDASTRILVTATACSEPPVFDTAATSASGSFRSVLRSDDGVGFATTAPNGIVSTGTMLYEHEEKVESAKGFMFFTVPGGATASGYLIEAETPAESDRWATAPWQGMTKRQIAGPGEYALSINGAAVHTDDHPLMSIIMGLDDAEVTQTLAS